MQADVILNEPPPICAFCTPPPFYFILYFLYICNVKEIFFKTLYGL